MEQFQMAAGTVTLDTTQQAFQQVAQPIMVQGLPIQFLQQGAAVGATPTQFPTAIQTPQPQVFQCVACVLYIVSCLTHYHTIPHFDALNII